jgi:hypothetical protein
MSGKTKTGRFPKGVLASGTQGDLMPRRQTSILPHIQKIYGALAKTIYGDRDKVHQCQFDLPSDVNLFQKSPPNLIRATSRTIAL